MTLSDRLKKLRQLISSNNIEDAIEDLSLLLSKSKKLDNVLTISARLNELKVSLQRGTIEHEKSQVERSRISHSLLDVIREVELMADGGYMLERLNDDKATQSAKTIQGESSQDAAIIVGRDINVIGKVAAGRDIHIKNFFQNFISSRLFFAGLLSIVICIIFFSFKNEIYWELKNKISTFDPDDKENLKILILPFKPDINCTDIEVDYKGQIIERLKSKKKEEDLSIDLLVLERMDCPATDEEALSIARDKNADLVIWGSFEEDLYQGVLKGIRLRYSFSADFQLDPSKRTGDTEMQSLKELGQLRQGYLQESIDYIIHWVEGTTAYQIGNLKEAVDHFDKILTDSTNYQEIETFWFVSEILSDLGQNKEALRYSEKAIYLTEESDDLAKLAASYFRHGVNLNALGRFEQARSFKEKAISIINSTEDKDSTTLSVYLNSLGYTMARLGHYEKAVEYQTKAIEILESINGDDNLALAHCYNNLSETHRYQSQLEKALNAQEKALELRQNQLGSVHPLLAQSFNNLGLIHEQLGNDSMALLGQQEALAIRKKVLDENHPDIAMSFNNLAGNYRSLGDYEKALSYQNQALEIQERVLEASHPDIAQSYNNLGLIFQGLNKFEHSLKSQQKALKIRLKVLPPDHPDIGTSYNNISTSYLLLEDYDEALKAQYKALRIDTLALPADHPHIAMSLGNLAKIYRAMGDPKRSIGYYKQANSIFIKGVGEEHPYVVITYNYLGQSYIDLDAIDNALLVLEKAYSICQKNKYTRIVPRILSSFSLAYEKLGDRDRAIEFQNKTVAAYEAIHPSGNVKLDEAREILNKLKQKT